MMFRRFFGTSPQLFQLVKPKQPPSAFSLFFKENRAAISNSQSAGSKNAEIMKVAAGLWKQMGEAEKKPFVDRCASLKATYLLEKKKYLESLPPKKPANSYALYVKDITPTLKAENPGLKQDAIIKLAGQNWKSLDESLKKKYKDLYESKLTEYKKSKELI